MRLEDQLIQYENQLLFMLMRVIKMFQLAQEALRTQNKEKALEVIEMDDYINHIDEDINHQATEMLSLQQPVAKDLRSIIAGIKISTDLERIGDYAKNVGRFVIKNQVQTEKLIELTLALVETVIKQLEDMFQALKENNVELAYKIPEQDDMIDQAFVRTVVFVEEMIHGSQKDLNYPIQFVTMLRSLERAGDHIKNICESLIYKIKGQHIDFG